MAPFRVGPAPLRRGVGAALVVLLLVCAVLYYRASTSAPVAASNLTTPPSTSLSPVVGPEPSPSTSTPGAGGHSGSSSAEPRRIQVYGDRVTSAKPFQTVRIRGTYHGGADTYLQAERREGATWVPFPLSAKTDRLGRFITHVEFGARGPHWVRMADPVAKVHSEPFVLVIKG